MTVLGNYISIKHGFAFKGEHISSVNNNVVLVTPGNFSIGGGFQEKKCKYYDGEFSDEYVLHAGDLIVTMTDLSKQGDTLGYGALVPCSKNRVYLHNQRIGLVNITSPDIDKGFLYWFLRTPFYHSSIVATASGSTVKHTSPGRICDVSIVLPSILEQKKIAAILSCLDSKIELNNKINKNLEQQAQALFDKLMFVSDNTECRVSDIAYLNPKRPLSKKKMARCIDMSQLSTTGAFPSGWEMKPFTGGMRFVNGDTLLARITPCLENGKTAFIDFLNENEVAFGSTEYIVLAPKEGVPSEFLYCLARYPAFVDYAVKNMNGSSGRQRVSAETIGQFALPEISKSDLSAFAENVVPMFKEMRCNFFENLRLAEIRDALLPKLMNGEIDIDGI